MTEEKQAKEGESTLRPLRERAGLTQEELARRCGIPVRTYQRWETGETEARPSVRQIKALCRELKIPIEDLPDEFAPRRSQSEDD
ncbi:MAG TPA: helix-turn-helix transcriptional regulator [Waterburya sp.]|jgi:transcriptional regulator with XRE-family HTH domain